MIGYIKLASIVGNLAYILSEYTLFSRANHAVLHDLQHGKIGQVYGQVYGNATEFLAGLASSRDCYAGSANRTRSNTIQFLELGLEKEAIETFRNIENVYECLQNPYSILAMTERMAWGNLNMRTSTDEENMDVDLPNSDEMVILGESFSDLTPYVVDRATFYGGLTHIQNRFVAKVHGESSGRIHYKKGIQYLEQLVDIENDELARELLNPSDFKKYKEETSRLKKDATAANRVATAQDQDHGSSYYAKGKILLGAMYELFYVNASHTPFLDIINQVRVKILEYVRQLRDNYNYYNDMIHDTGNEMTAIAKKTAVAWDRAKWLVVNGGVLVVQAGELLVDDVAPIAIEYIKYII